MADTYLSTLRNRYSIPSPMPALTHLETCTDKVAALWNETAFWGDNGAQVNTMWDPEPVLMEFFFTEMKPLVVMQVYIALESDT